MTYNVFSGTLNATQSLHGHQLPSSAAAADEHVSTDVVTAIQRLIVVATTMTTCWMT